MTNEVKQDVASEGDLKKALDEALKRGETLIRLEMPNTPSLASLEKLLEATIESKMRAGALVSVSPVFEAWVEAATWPIYPQGWTVLLRRRPFQVRMQPEVAQAAQQSKLVKS